MSIISQNPLSRTNQDFSIQVDQDGLFFGLEYLTDLLKTKKDLSPFEITSYFKDGDCVFKGQTLMQIHTTANTNFKKEDLSALVAYLSGAYTLLSCWTRKHFDFSIMACPTSDFSFSEGEEKAILSSGAVIEKKPNNICFYPEDVEQALKNREKRIILSDLKMSEKQIKSILSSLNPVVETALCGSCLPSDLEEFRTLYNIKAVYPLCLQGYFPSLKTKTPDATDSV